MGKSILLSAGPECAVQRGERVRLADQNKHTNDPTKLGGPQAKSEHLWHRASKAESAGEAGLRRSCRSRGTGCGRCSRGRITFAPERRGCRLRGATKIGALGEPEPGAAVIRVKMASPTGFEPVLPP